MDTDGPGTDRMRSYKSSDDRAVRTPRCYCRCRFWIGWPLARCQVPVCKHWADQVVDIADDGELDPRDREIRTGVRQWLMSKLAPRRYGDKVQIGGDPESPLQVMHRQVSLSELTEAQLDALDTFTQSLLIEAQPD